MEKERKTGREEQLALGGCYLSVMIPLVIITFNSVLK